MSDERGVEVRLQSWDAAHAELIRLRTEVFVAEQGVPPELEIDGEDPQCLHVVARDVGGAVIGTGRMRADGRIGRMAVERAWRGRGVGSRMLVALLAEAERRELRPWLSAQAAAVPFYERHGFVPEGERYEEAGIPHQRMRLSFG